MGSTDLYSSEIKETLLNFEIDGTGKIWLFADFLINELEMSFYSHEIYYITNDAGFRVKRLPLVRQIHKSLFLKYLGISQQPYRRILKDKINEAIGKSDYNSFCFADMLCEITKEKELKYCDEMCDENHSSNSLFISGDEEAEECNRQFFNMISDFDAYGNIDILE